MQLFAVIGYPLKHSLSPYMHTAALAKTKIEGAYVPFEIVPMQFEAVMKSLKVLPFTGYNVTVPYKEKVIPYLDRLDTDAKAIGAVNSIHYSRGRLIGYNTDVYGFLCSLKESLSMTPCGKRVLVLGAGGAARAVVYALLKEKAQSVVVMNRTLDKAKKIIHDMRPLMGRTLLGAYAFDEKYIKKILPAVDLIVNTTSVGLKKSDPLLLPARMLPQRSVAVYDLIYNPAKTKLLQTAERRGYRIANGLGMLVYQGARSFEIWTGKKAPVAVMKKAIG